MGGVSCCFQDKSRAGEKIPSLVMNEMNSLTHSCMHSLASLAIFAFSGNAIFMIRATGAKFRMLASDTKPMFAPFDLCCGGEDEDCGEADDMILRCKATVFFRHRRSDRRAETTCDSMKRRLRRAIKVYVGLKRRQSWLSQHAGDGRSAQIRTRGRRIKDQPFAIGSHLSCSLTSNSYPSPCACVS